MNKKKSEGTDPDNIQAHGKAFLRELYHLSGEEILEQIQEHDNPNQLVQQFPHEDFYWLVKKVGAEDCIPLLKSATQDQWQFLLDLELWRKDRLDNEEGFGWVDKLREADPEKLASWFFEKGQAVAYFYFFNKIQLQIKEHDEPVDFGEDFFTFDGTYYVRVLEKKEEGSVRKTLWAMVNKDPLRFQDLLNGLAGLLPAEFEENMYRMRNIRLAEHGFLPYDEAISVYAHLKPEAINHEETEPSVEIPDEEIHYLVPVIPLTYTEGRNLLTNAVSIIDDNLLLDRIRLEFAGLCNQILSADGVVANELDLLIETCRKAGGYLNLALERLCGENISTAVKLLRINSLESIFRVGFGQALELKWEVERWVKKSWFSRYGLDFSFWRDIWAETLAGLSLDRPKCFSSTASKGNFKDFDRISDLDECRRVIRQVKALDVLLERLEKKNPLDNRLIETPGVTFHVLLFNTWARLLLRLESRISAISLDQAKALFAHLRGGEDTPPYRMPGFEEKFINDLLSTASDCEPEIRSVLKDCLSLIWHQFSEEYERLTLDYLDSRFTRFILIE